MAQAKITKRLVDSLKPDMTAFDTDLKGFMVRARGVSKTYAIKYSINGRQRIYTIGKHGPLTPEQARAKAQVIAARVANNEDPQSEREAAHLRGRKTFADLAALYLEEHARTNKKPRSCEEDERLLKLHLLPALGRFDIEAISKADFFRVRSTMKDTPIAFNRARALASKMFTLAEKWGLRQTANPTRFVDKYPERGRERFLSNQEYGRLFDALAQSEGREHPSVLACIRLLALTGARLSEILSLKWEWVDFERAALRLPDSKTGAKVIILAAPALKILADLPRLSPYVLLGATLEGHFVGIQRPWRRIRARAGLPGLRLHDLRHGFASIAAASGESMKLIGAALGHRQSSTTNKYAHLSDDPIRALVERTATRMMSAPTGSPSNVVAVFSDRHPQ